MRQMTLTEIENLEAIIVSHLDKKVVEVILKDGTETGGIVDEANETYTKFTLVNGNGEYRTVALEEVENVYYL